MGLANDKKQYNVLMASCRDCFYRANMDIWKTLNQQEPGKVPAAINAARTIPGNEILSTFENDWATREFFMQTMREKRKQFKAAERREALAAIMRGSVPTITQNAQRATAGLAGQTNGPVHPEVGKAHGVRPSQNDDDSDHEDDEHEQPPSEDESNAESGTESSEYE
ncbi:hypothetical protein FRB99_006827 [Tulasnella sp. 403]|nr:hypothetical protein FRB99_006827 [Tulasnella sp. 403]